KSRDDVSQHRYLSGTQVLKLTPAAIIGRIETARYKIHVYRKVKTVYLEHQAAAVDPALAKRFQPGIDAETTGRQIRHRELMGCAIQVDKQRGRYSYSGVLSLCFGFMDKLRCNCCRIHCSDPCVFFNRWLVYMGKSPIALNQLHHHRQENAARR